MLKMITCKKIRIIILIVLGVIILVSAVFINSKANAKTKTEEVLDTVVLKKMDLEKSISLSGKIKSKDSQTITSALSDVMVKNVPVEVGSKVKAGDIICVLDSTPYENQKKLAEVSAGISKGKSNITEEAAARNLKDVEKTKEIETARVQNASLTANTDYNKAISDSNSKKSDYDKSVSNTNEKEKEKESALKALEKAKSNLVNKKRAYESLSSTYKDSEAESKLNNAMAAIKSAEEKLSVAQSELKTSQEMLESVIADPTSSEEQKSKAQAEVDKKNQNVINAQKSLDDLNKAKSDLEANYASVQSAINQAKREYEDAEILVSKRQTTYDTAVADYTTAQSTVDAQKSAYESSTSTIKTAKQTYEDKLQTQEDTIRKNEKNLEDTEGTVQGAQMDTRLTNVENAQKIEEIQKKIDDCTIKATKDGVVTAVQVKPGETFKGGDVVTVQDASSFQISAAVGQTDISDLSEQMPVRIKADTTGELEMKGQIIFIAPLPLNDTNSVKTASTSTTTTSNSNDYEIKTSIDNPSERLRLGMNVKLTIIEKQASNVFAIPSKYITTDEKDGSYVTVIDQYKNQRQIKVVKGLETDYNIEISSKELKEGMEILAPENGIMTESGEDSTNSILY